MTTEEKALLELLDKIGTERAQELLDIKDKEIISTMEKIIIESGHEDKREIRDIINVLKNHRNFMKQVAQKGRVIPGEHLLQSEYTLRELIQEDYEVSDKTIDELMYCRPKTQRVASGCGETLILLTIAGAKTSKQHGDIQIGDRIVEVGAQWKRLWGQGQGLVPREIHKRFYDAITKAIPGIHEYLKIEPSGMIRSIMSGDAFGTLLMKVGEVFPGYQKLLIKTYFESVFERTPQTVINYLVEKAWDRVKCLKNWDTDPCARRYGHVVSVSLATLILSRYAKEDQFTDFLYIDNDTYDVKHIDMVNPSLDNIYTFCDQFKWGSRFGFGSMDASIQLTGINDKTVKIKKNCRSKTYRAPRWIKEYYGLPEED